MTMVVGTITGIDGDVLTLSVRTPHHVAMFESSGKSSGDDARMLGPLGGGTHITVPSAAASAWPSPPPPPPYN